mmetsp:Transcript_10651/g.32012  ORF Transcript_10651/g.32012 Transcript_10651/m.32012 type:complete len:184 (+) Transcript_10651:831-1382(+)
MRCRLDQLASGRAPGIAICGLNLIAKCCPEMHLHVHINAAVQRSDAGDSVEEGSILKLVGNFFIAGAIELLAEGMTLSDAAGLQREKLLEWLNLMIPGVIFEGYGGRMAKGLQRVDGEGFAVDMAIKDASHIQRLAQETRASVPTIATVLDHLKGAQAKGRGDWDWSAVAATVREASGRNAEP